MTLDAASLRQIEAAHPHRSTWVSANAGSGKTRVLTDRVARLLLADVPPDHILCLTYTKAAATEMQNRLFRRLGDWAMLSDNDLRAGLVSLGVDVPDSGFLSMARTLFARAIETPGGLRIQTIHSFCASLLRRFPLEAGVSPQFTEIEDRAAELLRAHVLEAMANSPQGSVLQAIASHSTDESLETIARDVAAKRGAFSDWSIDALRSAYGLAPGLDMESLLADVFFGDTFAFVAECAAVCLTQGAKTDQDIGATLKQVVTADVNSLLALEHAVFTLGGSPRAKFMTKGFISKAFGPYWPRYESLCHHVIGARETRLALAALERDTALHQFADAFLPRYATEKLRRGWLDFDDLIDRASQLLRDPKVAAWVLYRLDGGIDHILVDEAQDTSPRQWEVIERLAQEFTAGQGARAEVTRTIFVVGDKKQSIYSFQGADATEFDRMKAEFATRLHGTGSSLQDLTLEYSFRSADPILRLVDSTFDGRVASGFADEKHRAFKHRMPGRVDLWPVVPKAQDDETGVWYQPVDRISPNHHAVTLAQRIAYQIRNLIDTEHPLPVEGKDGSFHARPVQAGDFLILVRGRQRLFAEIIRACKQQGLPIAGADRLKVMAELAVRDIAALLSFLDTPEDDLALATVLRSPLFGISEQALFDLAHRRTDKWLWTALRGRRADFPQVMSVLDDLRVQADFLRPYDLIERVLTRHDGRRRLLGRLGEEAEDGIDALLTQALAYEQTEVPTLTGFLQWMQTDDLTIKREMDSAGNRIRVMTVHGAKGLEAPIVILPDCARPSGKLRDVLIADDAGLQWKANAALQPVRQQATTDALRSAQARERDRLLYVAMTRAEKWLIVAAVDDLHKDGDDWYSQVQTGMSRVGAGPCDYDFGPYGAGRGMALGDDWSGLVRTKPPEAPQNMVDLPDWASQPAPPPMPPLPVGTPSGLGGPKALPGADGDETEAAMQRGTLVHLLLEHLPQVGPSERAETASALLRRAAPDLPQPDVIVLIGEASKVLNSPDLAHLFVQDALTEVDISSDLPGLGTMAGVIDRLIVTDDSVTAVDFKTNRTVPETFNDCPDGLLRQMGAYAAMLARVYPDKRIETGFLWTHTATYMALPHDVVTAALKRADLDAGGDAA